MLDASLQELETWRRDLRHAMSDLIVDKSHDAPLRLVNVANAMSYAEVAIRALQGVQNSLAECEDIVERIEAEREVIA